VSVDLANAVVVITGAGSGIGAACARSFAKRGACVVVTDIDAARAEKVASEIGDQAVGLRCDVTSMEDLEAARDLALERFGRVDVVMNNVGLPVFGAVEDIPLEGWERLIDVNLLGMVRSNLVFLPLLMEQGSGHIVNTASIGGLLPYGHDRLPYTTTKHAVVGLTKGLAVHLRAKGIGVTCLCPAQVPTNIAELVTVYGKPTGLPVAPQFPIVEAEVVGEQVADAIEAGRFLVLTTPEVAVDLREQGDDMDAYIERVIEQYT
jgi:NAD(P)-dependent dehydrogenase (short-subunit alcohol dehydrogenase family)